jgi:hypothetical protein
VIAIISESLKGTVLIPLVMLKHHGNRVIKVIFRGILVDLFPKG